MSSGTKFFKKQNFKDSISTCYYCEEILTQETCEVEHIIPKSKGGTCKKDNLVFSCSFCNRIKHNYSKDYLISKLSKFINKLQNA